ncbi:MAG: glycosyltransferase family 4 protein [Limisphaera sp.]|nr:glycosyltransferase family 4 protein [Limisphaera sp.]
MARVAIVVQVFPPDNVATAQLYGDLALDLVKYGHEVRVFTSKPYYSDDPLATQWRVGLRTGFPWRTSHQLGLRICRCWMPQRPRSLVLRVLSWAWLHAATLAAALPSRWRPDVILAPSPPPTIALVAWALARRFGVPFVYNVQELYPDVAINLGMVRNPLLIRCLRHLERFTYRQAARVTVISRRMYDALRTRGVPAEKVVLIPNFADTAQIQPVSRENGFSREFGLRDCFVVSYAGNMGKPQHLETLVHAAARLQSVSHVRFLLIGDGTERPALQRLAQDLGLPNVQFVPYQPYARMNEIYACSNICYVPQAGGTATDGVPSKVYRILAAGRPVIAATEPDSDLGRLVLESGAGLVVSPTDAAAVARAVEEIRNQSDFWEQRGAEARRFVERHYGRAAVTRQYHELLVSVAQESHHPAHGG